VFNLDDWTVEELTELVENVEQDKHQTALRLFPDKEPGYVKACLALARYAKARIDMLDDLEKGREHKRKNHENNLSKAYRAIPEFAQW
jgi:hypothetical protein